MTTKYLAGLDLGSVQVKLVVLEPAANHYRPLITMVRPNLGETRRVAMEMLDEAAAKLDDRAFVCLGVTGASSGLLTEDKTPRSVNQMAAAVAATSLGSPGIRTIIDLGGQFSTWILVRHDAEATAATIEDFALNGLCAAGSGVFLEQQAARLRLSVAELGRLAEHAARGATIAGRCSVFAKSDMIHLQQKGTPLDEIAYGLCLALARTFVITVLEKRPIEGPVAFIGGGAANAGLLRAFREVLDLSEEQIIIPEDPIFFCALGAALTAADFPPMDLGRWLKHFTPATSFTISPPPAADASPPLPPPTAQNRIAPPQPPLATRLSGGMQKIPVHLGIDVGSVSTNVVLLSPQLEYLDGAYVATSGRPVEAIDAAMRQISQGLEDRLQVLSVGATGSGRYLAERLVGVDTVKNEITAQLVSASHYFPEVESVFEIGGQDAKFISAQNGLLQVFAMNKLCSAGTGSFLEEQAERLGVAIVDQFSELAFKSLAPVNLGSRCTVFMDGELCRTMAANARVEDLCAGLAYAVARNFLEKVVDRAKIGNNVVFQGGTCANLAVVSAFTSLLGRPLLVHPHGPVSGAIGGALLAAKEWAIVPDRRSSFQGFAACREHRLVSFECGECANHCRVNQVRVGTQLVHFGDTCERYSAGDDAGKRSRQKEKKLPFRELFAAREALLQDALPKTTESSAPRIGLIRGSLMLEYLPFWSHLLVELGFDPVVVGPRVGMIEGQRISPLLCLPQKLAAAEVEHLFLKQGVERVLLPSILELSPQQAGDRPHTCLYSQQLPDMLRHQYSDRLLVPQLGLADSRNLRREGSLVLAELLGVTVKKVRKAWQIAMQYQAAFVDARLQLGDEALATLDRSGVVVIGKPYNLHDSRANLGLARQLARLGLPALPMDLLPLSDERLDEHWYMLPWLLNRQQLRALQLLSRSPHLFPIHVSSYGCGPDAFTTKHLLRYSNNRPRLFLEFDGHQGEAGLVTRLEAFADEIESFTKRITGPRRPPEQMERRLSAPKAGSRCFLPNTSEHVYAYAGMPRRVGLEPYILPPADGESARRGEEVSSGRECHPYTVIAGDLVKLITGGQLQAGDRFFLPATRLPCLLSQYGDGFRHILKDLGEDRLKIFDQHPGEAAAMFGPLGMIELYEGLTIIDYLVIASCHFRPYEVHPGSVDRWLAESCLEVQACLADKSDKRSCLARCLDRLAETEIRAVGTRPIVGVTGDLYTRINRTGNGDLFSRLEELGCEVWPSPFFAASTDFELPQNSRRWRRRGKLTKALTDSATAALLKQRAGRLAARLSPELRARCVEPPQPVLQAYARPYINENSNHLIRTMIAKMIDFARRGADGVISAIGHNCMAGTAAAAAISQIRRDHGGLPIISLTYGNTKAMSQTLQLDTFVQQVHDRHES